MSEERSFTPPSPEALAEVRALADRQLTPDEFEAYVGAPMSAQEEEGILDLIRWFCRSYPTPLERLAYVRRAYARWTNSGSNPRLL